MLTINIIAQLFAVIVSLLSFRKKSVSISGLWSMLIISSFFIWNNGIEYLCVLFAMFLSSSLITKFKHDYKSMLTDKVLKKSGPRDAIQAICNLGIATLCFVIFLITKDTKFLLALFCSVAASNADSWASEIGVLSKKEPILITNFKTCKAGISGGVTLLGTFAGLLGAVFIALISLMFLEMCVGYSKTHLFVIVSGMGFFGVFVDSFLGATLQVIYKDSHGFETENAELAVQKSRGYKGINNDFVNFSTTFLIALFAVIIF